MGKDFLIIGARVLAALVIGVTVFLTTGSGSKSENPRNQDQDRKRDDNLGSKENLNGNGGSSSGFWNPEVQQDVKDSVVNNGDSQNQQNQQMNQKPSGEKIISGLRGVNMTIGRLSQVINSLTDITRSIMRLFGKDVGPRQQYCANPWSSGQIPVNRVNPYIIQVGPTYDNNNCGYYGQQYCEY